MFLVFLPYVLQLLCIIHIIKTHQNTSWIWIVVFVPYIGGIAYLFIELIPYFMNANKINDVRDSLTDFIKPDQKFEVIKEKALYSATYKNMIEYADALIEKKQYAEAMKIYYDQNRGAFLDDPELQYRIANGLYCSGDFNNALLAIEKLLKSNKSFEKKDRENILYLRIIEEIKNADVVQEEYKKVLQRIQNNSIELPYINFLIKNDDKEELRNIFSKIHADEHSMKINKVRYNRQFYNSVYQIERRYNNK